MSVAFKKNDGKLLADACPWVPSLLKRYWIELNTRSLRSLLSRFLHLSTSSIIHHPSSSSSSSSSSSTSTSSIIIIIIIIINIFHHLLLLFLLLSKLQLSKSSRCPTCFTSSTLLSTCCNLVLHAWTATVNACSTGGSADIVVPVGKGFQT